MFYFLYRNGLWAQASQFSIQFGRYLLWTYFKFYASFLQVTIYYGNCGKKYLICHMPVKIAFRATYFLPKRSELKSHQVHVSK